MSLVLFHTLEREAARSSEYKKFLDDLLPVINNTRHPFEHVLVVFESCFDKEDMVIYEPLDEALHRWVRTGIDRKVEYFTEPCVEMKNQRLYFSTSLRQLSLPQEDLYVAAVVTEETQDNFKFLLAHLQPRGKIHLIHPKRWFVNLAGVADIHHMDLAEFFRPTLQDWSWQVALHQARETKRIKPPKPNTDGYIAEGMGLGCHFKPPNLRYTVEQRTYTQELPVLKGKLLPLWGPNKYAVLFRFYVDDDDGVHVAPLWKSQYPVHPLTNPKKQISVEYHSGVDMWGEMRGDVGYETETDMMQSWKVYEGFWPSHLNTKTGDQPYHAAWMEATVYASRCLSKNTFERELGERKEVTLGEYEMVVRTWEDQILYGFLRQWLAHNS
jgi:hypothetical protein